MHEENIQKTGASRHDLRQLLHLFEDEHYLLWWNTSNEGSVILLKEEASKEIQAKSFLHLLRLCEAQGGGVREANQTRSSPAPSGADMDMIQLMKSTLQENNKQWTAIKKKCTSAGWDLDRTQLERGVGHRIRVTGNREDKKER
jgi:hypothetical protein